MAQYHSIITFYWSTSFEGSCKKGDESFVLILLLSVMFLKYFWVIGANRIWFLFYLAHSLLLLQSQLRVRTKEASSTIVSHDFGKIWET